jgi:tetratricopeptide (TPR) repeat protein
MFNNQEFGYAKDDYIKIVANKGAAEQDAKAAFYLAECYFQLKDYPKAQNQFKDYLVRFTKHELRVKAQFRFAEALYLQKNYLQAAQAYERFVKDNESDTLVADALYAGAGAYMEIGENAAAQPLLERLTKDFPSNPQIETATYFMAWAKFRAKEFSKSAELFIEFSKKYPNSSKKIESLLRAADAFYSGENFQQSLIYYNRVLADGQGVFRKDCHVGIAWSYYKLKEFEKAGNYFLILARESQEASNKSEYYYQCLRSYYDGANYSKGQNLGEEMLKACQGLSIDGDVHYWMGLFALKLNKDSEAAQYLTKAAEGKVSQVSPATILSELGNLYQKQGSDDKALDTYKKAISLSVADPALQSQLRYEASRVLHKLGRTKEAIEMVANNLKDSQTIQGKEILGLSEFSMGEFKYSQGDYASALQHYAKVNAANEKDAQVVQDSMYRSAWSWRYLKDFKRAYEAFESLEKISEKYRQEARFLMAEIKKDQGVFAEAISLYEKVGQIEGKFGAHAQMAKAQIQFDQGQKAESRLSLMALLRDFPNSEVELQAHLLLAEIAYDNKDTVGSLKNYDVVVSKGKGTLLESAYYGRAWLYYEQSKYPEAIKDLDDLLKAFTETSYKKSALQLKGQILMQTHRLDEAREVFSLGLGGEAEGGESLMLNLASVETELGQYEKALDVYNQLLTKYPNTDLQGRVIYEKGWLYMEMKRPNEALLMFKAYQKAYPDGPLVEDVNFALGHLAYDRSAYKDAIEAYGKCLASERYKDKALYKIAYCYLKLDDFVHSGEAFSRLVQESPLSPLRLESLYREGQAWLKASEFDKAMLALKKYCEEGRSDSFYADALCDLGMVCEKLKNVDQAIHYYEMYLKIFPKGEKVSEVGVYLAHHYLSKKQYSEARQVLAKSLLDKTHFLALEAQYLEGEAYFSEGRFEDAIRSLIKLQSYEGGDEWQAKGLIKIAYSHRELKRNDRARQYCEKCLKLYPNTEAAREAVEALKTLGKT